jgi:hypothetical protein
VVTHRLPEVSGRLHSRPIVSACFAPVCLTCYKDMRSAELCPAANALQPSPLKPKTASRLVVPVRKVYDPELLGGQYAIRRAAGAGLQFGVFENRPANPRVVKHGVKLKLQDESLQILLLLLEHPYGSIGPVSQLAIAPFR